MPTLIGIVIFPNRTEGEAGLCVMSYLALN